MTLSEMSSVTEVTPNAVRQRLARLMAQALVDEEIERTGQHGKQRRERGRPTHLYSLTEKARRQAGDNFADFAMVLWVEIRAVDDPDIRRGLLQRVADALTRQYRGSISGATLKEKMLSLTSLFSDRRVTMSTTRREAEGELPILVVEDCPYPQLAEQDRAICAVETMMFSDLLGEKVQLTHCRLDGERCCQFQIS